MLHLHRHKAQPCVPVSMRAGLQYLVQWTDDKPVACGWPQ